MNQTFERECLATAHFTLHFTQFNLKNSVLLCCILEKSSSLLENCFTPFWTQLKNSQKIINQKSWCIHINTASYSTCHCHFISCFSLQLFTFICQLSATLLSSFPQRIFTSFVYTEKTSNGETEVQQVSYPSSSLDTEWVSVCVCVCVCVCGLEGQRTPIKILQLLSAVFEAIFVLSTTETLIPTSIDCTVSLPNKL